ncbi:MAG: hypothetical protein JJ884_04585 [Maricaulis sp.]|jgi:hypothetical protein|uniref:hypothetical protein n=1 Tax=Maricaulis sp. TaxID=1486257 RepID=UPI001B18F23F|nr:hypothetical protein [Maricaulis sp.]MBO6728229.1 hypothetical protein [Maricaulis sp.]MBO6846774.1 hypothetical protein [Maricaulis sp.]MBO6877865.1 hypothetical protein [Maricaulis sp.]
MRTLLAAALIATSACATATASDLTLDDSIRFDASLDELRPVFDASCASWEAVTLNPAELPIAQTSHVQVNCQGFRHAGGNRLAEFVFADDSMAFVWVLIDAGELDGFAQDMRGVYGAPTHDTAMFTAFADHNAALRRDIPEFLFYSQSIAPMYRGWFDQMAAQ